MRREDDPAVRAAIQACREAFDADVPYTAATWLGTLLEAEESDVIAPTWRGDAAAEAVERMVLQEQAEVERGWRRDFAHLERMLDIGLLATEEEALLVLQLRDELEAAKRFVPDVHEGLELLDEALRAELRSNGKLYDGWRRRRQRADLARRLPGHWWWRR
jgi:hypothetical protein